MDGMGRGKGVLDTHFLLLLLIWKSADGIAGIEVPTSAT